MVRFLQLVIGPAGVGKSTYCKTIQEHGQATHRLIHIGNLDPAAENIDYEPSFDIRDLVKLDEVMEETGLGPNGGLVYCMEFILQNMEWLQDQLESFGEDDYILLDCPGQIELYSHLPIMKVLVERIVSMGYRVVCVNLLDALFLLEPNKFIAGCMLALSAMIQLEQPWLNVITKCDLAEKEQIEKILDCEGASLIHRLGDDSPAGLRRLSAALASVLDDYLLVSFAPLDPTDEESIEDILSRADFAMQYGEDIEPRDPQEDEEGGGDEETF